MLKTCSVCGKIHDLNKVCYGKKNKKKTIQSKFRNTYKWKQKTKVIKKRDNYLCKVCVSGKYDTEYLYNYKQLEVHHIVPLSEDYDKRLDSNNLITLCNMHHKMAEEGLISREELINMVEGSDK